MIQQNGIEDLARRQVQYRWKERGIDVVHGNFPAKVTEAIWKSGVDEDWGSVASSEDEAKAQLRRLLRVLRPDAYAILPDDLKVICFEIEDTSTMGREKLMRYVDAFWEVDAYAWHLHLVTTCRYGLNETEIYIPFFFHAMVEEASA